MNIRKIFGFWKLLTKDAIKISKCFNYEVLVIRLF